MGDGNELTLRQEVSTAIQGKVDPVVLTTTILPRIERALQLAQTPEETNEIRAQIETITTYLKRSLPKALADRREQFKYTHEGDMLYLRASAQAGALWGACENKTPRGNYSKSENFRNSISWQDAGFKSDRDVTTCTRISEIHEEDWRTYEEETLTNMRQPTLNGLENIWRLLYNAEQEEVPLPDGKYRVIYADPPWKYGNNMPDYFYEQADHYPLMTVKEVAAMPVGEIAEDNSVLFIWVTSPILEESFEVINSWGFEYKSSFVWDKIKHNMGHYNSVRHEFLLVCVRGSCQPDVQKLFDSVVSIERAEHSAKPEFFREIIDTIYPYGKRIELFARKKTDGWDVYGNEPALS